MEPERHRTPYRRILPTTIWTLVQRNEHGQTVRIVGQFSTDAKAIVEVSRLIAAEAQIDHVRLPQWTPTLRGRELIYGRQERCWHFELQPWTLDATAV